MSATKNVNQSRPRSLVRDADRTAWAPPGEYAKLVPDTVAQPAPSVVCGLHHECGLVGFVFRRCAELIARYVHQDRRARETYGRPLHRDFARANPQEAAELDDGRAHTTALVDEQ